MEPHVAARLLVAGVCVVAPTLLFVGLWRGLVRMRDDDLVNRVLNANGGGFDVDPARAVPPALAPVGPDRKEVVPGSGGGGDAGPALASAGPGICRSCGAVAAAGVEYCERCRERTE
ncbi:hypothetical protein BRC94_03715 [Halobacteriales archaeon QS_5_70_17]|jgi:hypothetical protein|nr:MAG: hypothetical protein BRC94_03715 [Halobacteriales archaeon QS_5_70_17]